ncbi:MAG: phospholipid carrier-dependent glycosyltransferase [Gemmatimonadota bacterium]|nr:phospholipid carrier-dependent glycosyltransferase [Gemmatimonadota bacterium]MDE3173018.1 phospholipid carrier-dependent glycosyltransferase [Gemmatimonadota bacterium]
MRARLRPPGPPELYVLAGLAALTRFWTLFSPWAVVFDEVHYEKFVADYLGRVFYVDVHPPLANQIFMLWARLMHVGIPTLAGPHPAPAMRVVPALAGTLIIPVFYLLLRQLGAPRVLATLGGLLLLLDNALLAESRVLVPDALLILFNLGAVTCFLSARGRGGRDRWARLAGAALFAGLAVSIKWTGLSALGLIGLVWLADVRRERPPRRRWAGEGALLLAVPVALYVAVFAVHFARLTHYGRGAMFMPGAFKATLVGSPSYDPRVRVSFPRKFLDLNYAMRQVDASLVGTDTVAASPWYSWPLIERAIDFWSGPRGADGRQASIFLEGNPVLWYGIPLALVIAGVGLYRRRARFRAWRDPMAVLAAGYLINFLPFVLIQRVMYQYSYFMAFLYSLALAVVATGAWTGEAGAGGGAGTGGGWSWPGGSRARWYYGILMLAVAGFVWFAPLTYGWPLSQRSFELRFWIVTRHF